MKQIQEQIKKIVENSKLKGLDYEDYKLRDYLRELQKAFLRQLIKDYNTLKIDYNENEAYKNINTYELNDFDFLESEIKKYFSQFNKEDLKIQELKKININLQNVFKKELGKYANSLYNIETFEELENLYNSVDLSKLIKIYSYDIFDYNNKLRDYKAQEFKDNIKNILELFFNYKGVFEIEFFKNRSANIKIKDAEVHKNFYQLLLKQYFSRETRDVYINFVDAEKIDLKEYIIYFNKTDLFFKLKINFFDYNKLKQKIKVFHYTEIETDNLKCCIHIYKKDLSTRKDHILNNITESKEDGLTQQQEEQIKKFLGVQ